MNAFLFVPLYVATGLLCFLLLCFASHYFLVVLQSAAAGAEETVWSDDSFIEFFGKVFYLTIMAGFWLVPATILSSVLASTGIPKFPLGVAVFWLGFPITMLSSLSSESHWVPMAPSLFYRLAQRIGALVQFYLLSLPMVLAMAWSVGQVFQKIGPEGFGWTILASLALPAMWLLYAQLLGRFGLILSFTNDPIRSRRRPVSSPPPEAVPEPVARAVEVSDPWAVPELSEPFEENEIPVDEDAFVVDEEVARYTVAEESPAPSPPVTTPDSENGTESRRRRRPRRRRLDVLKEPASLFELRAITVLGEPKLLAGWIGFSLGTMAIGGLIVALMELWPE